MKPDEFIQLILPAAQSAETDFKIPAGFTVAQAALESSWGKSQLATLAGNLFGIKADPSWHGEVVQMPTREMLHGKWVTVPAKWRKYGAWSDSIVDHSRFLTTNPRYHPAFKYDDPQDFARAIQSCGYATDPDYADKIISIMRSHHEAIHT